MFKKIKITTYTLLLTFLFSSKAEIVENIKISGNEELVKKQ